MKKYLVEMKNGGLRKARAYEAENAAQAIVKANNEWKRLGWEVTAVYERIWHI